MKKLISTVLCLLILLSCILPAMAATGVPEEVMESTKSVVRILSKYYNGAATGSGFVIKNEPGEVLIATNDHVVEGNPTSISIWVGEDRMVDAEIVFTTSEKDLCVLKVTDTVDMKPLKLSKEEPQHGAAIYVVGYPGAGDILSDTQAHTSESVTITDGIISAIRSFTIEKGGNPVKLLQVNAAINSGNSGGPLFNTEGVVVGVNTYKVNADSQGVFGSVDISELWRLLDQYGIDIPEEPEAVEEVIEESSFLMPVLICAGVVCLVLTVILIAKRRKKNTPQRKRKNSKIQMVTLQAHMEKHPQGLGIGGAVSLLLSAAIQLRNLHNEGKLHLQICPENILISADGVTLKEPSSQETGRFNSGFAAPEIYKGAGFGITSDIYSFAAVLLYAATGKVPANSLQQEALDQDFDTLEDSVFAEIICKAMAFSILDRTQSMQELIYSIAVYNAPVQKKQPQPLRTVETVPASVREERPAPVKEEQVKIPKHRKKTVPKKKHRKLMPIATVLVCGIVAVVLMWKPAEKQEETAELQSTEQAETTVPMTPEEAAYAKAENLLTNGETAKAAIAFGKLGDYKDARQRSFALWREVAPPKTISASGISTAAVRKDGTVMLAGYGDYRQTQCKEWSDIISVSTCGGHTAGLKKDGTVVAVGDNQYNQCETSSWSDVVSIGTYGLYYTFGLKSDGTVVYTGSRGAMEDGHTEIQSISSWKDIASMKILDSTVFGIKTDGTVVVANIINGIKENGYAYGIDRELFEEWSDIISITKLWSYDSQLYRYIGLKSDGTLVEKDIKTVKNKDGIWTQMVTGEEVQSDIAHWTDIVAIESGAGFVIGLKANGTIVSTGLIRRRPFDLSDWSDIAAISAGAAAVIGVKNDGSAVFAGDLDDVAKIDNWSQLMKDWNDIALPGQLKLTLPKTGSEQPPKSDQATIYAEAEKLLANGETAKAAIAFGKLGDYKDARERSIALWEGDTVSAGPYHVIAIKNDGSVVAVGHDRFGQDQCQVQDWKDIVSVAASGELTAGLKSDGTVVVTYTKDLDFREAVSHWEDIMQISAAGKSVVGLKTDGSIVLVKQAESENGTPICDLDDDLSQWNDIVSISVCDGNRIAGRNDWKNSPAIAGLRKNGTVILHGFDEKIVQKVSEWRDIVSIHAAGYGICGRKADGTVVGVYLNQNIADAVSKWTDIVDIDSSSVEGGIYVIGVRSDGTISAWGDQGGLDGSSNWTDIVSLDIGDITGMCFKRPIVGLKADGTVAVTGWRGERPDLSAFTDIRLP